MAAVQATARAEWLLGIPPLETNSLASSRRVITASRITLISWARNQASRAQSMTGLVVSIPKYMSYFLLSARLSASSSKNPLFRNPATASLASRVSSATSSPQRSRPTRSTKVRLPSSRSEPTGLPNSS